MRPDTNYLTGPEMAQIIKIVDALNEVKPPENPISFAVEIFDCNGETAGYIGWTEDRSYAYYPSAAVSS